MAAEQAAGVGVGGARTAATREFGVRRAWYVVGLLTVLFIFSTIDRTILALLAEPVSTSLRLTDAQMGLIIGMGFAVLYSIAGLPLAHWIDTKTRRTLVMLGVVIWSAMTCASAFAHDFTTLILCRAGVAFGEAVLSPAAVSMIADMFPRQKRALPMSIYASIGGIFGSGAFIVGAAVLHLATPLALASGLAPWQMTMILLGAPGIVLGVLFRVTVPEPPRMESPGSEGSAGLPALFRYLKGTWPFYAPYILGIGLFCIFNYAVIAWLATILIRDHGFSVERAGYTFGGLGIVIGAIGTLLVPQLTVRIERARPKYGVPTTQLALVCLAAPFMIITPMSENVLALLVGVGFTILAGAAFAVLMPLGFQTYAPSRMRARLMATYLLSANLVGLSIGPIAAVALSKLWEGAERPLAHGIATLGMFVAPLVVACYVTSFRMVRRIDLAEH